MQGSSAPSVTNMSTDENMAFHMKNFSAEAYLDSFTFSKTKNAETDEFFRSLATIYHEVFSTHSPGERLLDVGSGPTLWHVMSASAKYKCITLSDPLPQNRHMQQMYMNDVSQDDRWTEHFKLTAKLEGNEEKWQEIRTRLRSSISGVIWCDIHEQHPLGEEQADNLYDCVMTSLCLDEACTDVSNFNSAVKKLVSLAKPGAPIVMAEAVGASFYEFGGSRFECVILTTENIQDALKAAGCTITKIMSSGTNSQVGDDNSMLVIEARKTV